MAAEDLAHLVHSMRDNPRAAGASAVLHLDSSTHSELEIQDQLRIAQLAMTPVVIKGAWSGKNGFDVVREACGSNQGQFRKMNPGWETWAQVSPVSNHEVLHTLADMGLRRTQEESLTVGNWIDFVHHSRTNVGSTALDGELASVYARQDNVRDTSCWDKLTQESVADAAWYPLSEGDAQAYSRLFIQPAGFRGGVHIEDPVGASYFYLRLLSGKKLVRIWPIFQRTDIQHWLCDQRMSPDDDPRAVAMKLRAFPGFETSRFTPQGFLWGGSGDGDAVEPSEAECRRLRDGGGGLLELGANASKSFMEVEMEGGDEVFVPSGMIHQVETLEPSVAVTSNYAFFIKDHGTLSLPSDRFEI